MIGSNNEPIRKNFRSTKDINHRIVYHVNPLNFKKSLLHGINGEPTKKEKNIEVKNSFDTGDENLKEHNLNFEKNNERLLKNSVSEFSLQKYDKNIRNEGYSKSEMRNKSQIKLRLATALLNLEKQEGKECSFLEMYIQNNFEPLRQESLYRPVSVKERCDMLLPNGNSQQNSNEQSNLKTKSDFHCFKINPSMADDIDPGKNSVVESNKSTPLKRDDSSRPKTSGTVLTDSRYDCQTNRLSEREMNRNRKLDKESIPRRADSVNRQKLINKIMSRKQGTEENSPVILKTYLSNFTNTFYMYNPSNLDEAVIASLLLNCNYIVSVFRILSQ